MIRVHLGNDKRHIVGQAVRARVADDDVAGLGEGVLVAGGGVGIEGREEEQRRAPGDRRLDEEVARAVGRAPPEQPGKVPVPPPLGPLAGGEPDQAEPRVILEPPHQVLPHHAGGPEHADLPSLRRHDVRPSAPGRSRTLYTKKPADG